MHNLEMDKVPTNQVTVKPHKKSTDVTSYRFAN